MSQVLHCYVYLNTAVSLCMWIAHVIFFYLPYLTLSESRFSLRQSSKNSTRVVSVLLRYPLDALNHIICITVDFLPFRPDIMYHIMWALSVCIHQVTGNQYTCPT